MLFRVVSRSLLAALPAVAGQAQFEIRGSRLYLNGEPFFLRGVAYRPAPMGAGAGPVLNASGCVYRRDLPLMARAGANTVRLYARIPVDDNELPAALERSGLYLLAGFPLEPYHEVRGSLAPESPLRARILRDFRDYIGQLRSKYRLVGAVFGDEVAANYDRKFAGSPADFYSLAQEAASAARPVLVATSVRDGSELPPDDAIPDLAFWSVNLNPGAAPGPVLDRLRRRTGKPLLIGELAASAWDRLREVEDLEAQARELQSLLRLVRLEPVIGTVVFEWTDEASRRTASGAAQRGPGERDRLGIFGSLPTEIPGLDALRPRPAAAALAAEWGGKLPPGWPEPAAPRLSPAGALNAASLAPLLAPGALFSLFGEELADPLATELTTVCVAERPADLLLASPGQVNGRVPGETAAGRAAVLVYRAGTASNVVQADIREAAPGIFERGVVEAGKACPVSVSNGVRPGAYLEIYATGLGPATPRAFLGSRELPVLYSGALPDLAGVSQANVQVPEDFPPSAPVGLRLFAGGVESNPYRVAIVSQADPPRLLLEPETLSFLAQAGGPPVTADLAIEARNGFCELVRLSVASSPEGVQITAPVGFPGRRIPVSVQVSAGVRAGSELSALIGAVSPLPENPAVRLRISVLPSRGEIPFRVISAGARSGMAARFEMAGRVIHEARGGGPGRGFNFVVLNGDTGILGPSRVFDTWLSRRASEEMADYLYGLPRGTVVLGAIADEGTLNLTARARAALRDVLGARLIDGLQYQDSWAILSRVGASWVWAEDASHDQPVVLERVLSF